MHFISHRTHYSYPSLDSSTPWQLPLWDALRDPPFLTVTLPLLPPYRGQGGIQELPRLFYSHIGKWYAQCLAVFGKGGLESGFPVH